MQSKGSLGVYILRGDAKRPFEFELSHGPTLHNVNFRQLFLQVATDAGSRLAARPEACTQSQWWLDRLFIFCKDHARKGHVEIETPEGGGLLRAICIASSTYCAWLYRKAIEMEALTPQERLAVTLREHLTAQSFKAWPSEPWLDPSHPGGSLHESNRIATQQRGVDVVTSPEAAEFPAQGEIPATAEKPQFPMRAEWLRKRLQERGWDHNDPGRFGGPDRKIVLKMLRGEAVKAQTLEKLMIALNTKKRGAEVTLLGIPTD